ncbi:MAG: hypothetical protein ACRYFX_04200 [Janthinobacterium lividum]
MLAQAKRIGRWQAAQAVTGGLGLAYLLAAVVLAPSTQRIDWGWLSRFDFWPSLLLAAATLYGCAWLYGGWAGQAIINRQRGAWWVGASVGVLTLLTTTLVGSAWNFGQEALRFAPFPGTPAAVFQAHVANSLYDYVAKPLAWIMPLGSVLAAGLGSWFGWRIRKIGLRATGSALAEVQS